MTRRGLTPGDPPFETRFNAVFKQVSMAECGRGVGQTLMRMDLWRSSVPWWLLLALFWVYGGDAPPMVNEAHYLAKAKHFWDPDWCGQDLFLASGKAHTTFYALFGWPTRWFTLETTAWVGRFVGWGTIAFGLLRLTARMVPGPYVSLVVATVWLAGIEYANLAGEWVIGGIEAKVPAYAFVLLGLAALAERRWDRVWIHFGLASAFHVLVGGWSVAAAAVVWLATESRRPDRQAFFRRGLFLGGGLALFGLVPAILLTGGATAEQSAAAARTYVYFRLPHHLLPTAFPGHWYGRHGALLAVTVLMTWLLWRRGGVRDAGQVGSVETADSVDSVDSVAAGDAAETAATAETTAEPSPLADAWWRIGWFVAATVGFAVIGWWIGQLEGRHPDLTAKLLRYYWFRLTDVTVPLLLGLVTAAALRRLPSHRRLAGLAMACLLLAVAGVGWSVWDRSRVGVPPSAGHRLLGWHRQASPEAQQATFRDWLAVCRWIRVATPEDEVFLTPRHQQSFKWYAGRAEVVNWKDVPQDAANLEEWRRRLRDVFPPRLGTVRVSIQYRTLRELADRYGARYLVVDRRVVGRELPLVRVYPRSPERNRTYAVYELPR